MQDRTLQLTELAMRKVESILNKPSFYDKWMPVIVRGIGTIITGLAVALLLKLLAS